jgi:hypothetical protein
MKNKYEINYYEVVSCMIKLIGEYDLFNRNHIYGTEGSRVIYLTTNGKCICTSTNSLRHFQMNMITIRCYMDGKSEDEKNFIKKQFPWIPYDNFLEWDDMYGKNIPDNILNYMKLKPSVEVSVNFPYGIPENGGEFI